MSFNQRIGREIAPPGLSWLEAPAAARLAFYREAADQAVAIKRAELARGIGANGRRMATRKHPRPDGATGPVLTPHRAASRTARLMAGHATVESVTIFWRSGHSRNQRLPWGTILGFHAAGQVPGAPARDVRLSKRGINSLKASMATWWQQHHGDRLDRERPARIAAEDAARRKRTRKDGGIAARARRAIERRYPRLRPYLNPPGGGF